MSTWPYIIAIYLSQKKKKSIPITGCIIMSFITPRTRCQHGYELYISSQFPFFCFSIYKEVNCATLHKIILVYISTSFFNFLLFKNLIMIGITAALNNILYQVYLKAVPKSFRHFCWKSLEITKTSENVLNQHNNALLGKHTGPLTRNLFYCILPIPLVSVLSISLFFL